MKKNATVAGALSALAALSGCVSLENQIPVIGVDQDGKPAEVLIAEGEYSQRLESLMSSYMDSALPVLERQDASSSGWMVRTFLLGVGINAEVGVGSVKVGAFPRFRLVFTNSKDPTLP